MEFCQEFPEAQRSRRFTVQKSRSNRSSLSIRMLKQPQGRAPVDIFSRGTAESGAAKENNS